MRHFAPPLAVAALARGMGLAAATARLIAPAGRGERGAPRPLRAAARAIAIAAITVAADQHGGAAARAQVASSR